jgi:hypothetical protein
MGDPADGQFECGFAADPAPDCGASKQSPAQGVQFAFFQLSHFRGLSCRVVMARNLKAFGSQYKDGRCLLVISKNIGRQCYNLLFAH